MVTDAATGPSHVESAEPDWGPWEGESARLRNPSIVDVKRPVSYREGDRTVRVAEMYFPAASYKGTSTRAFGYVAWPEELALRERLPALLLLHGGGGTADARWARWWARRGYVALSIDLAGQGPGREPLPDGGPPFCHQSFLLTHGLENTWMYHAVATSLAAVGALSALPQADPARIGVTGISWGGYFCATVMSLDARIGLGIPVYGAGFNGRAANGAEPSFTDGVPQREACDASRYLPRCRKPVLWVSTTGDSSGRPDEILRSAEITPGPNTLCLTVGPCHTDIRSIGRGERPEFVYFADSVFRGGEPLLRLGKPEVEGHTFRVPILPSTAPPVTRAALHYTKDLDKPWPERQWLSVRADVEIPMVSAEIPALKGLSAAAFVNAVDARDAIVASEWRVIAP